jgi:hypothetical protein
MCLFLRACLDSLVRIFEPLSGENNKPSVAPVKTPKIIDLNPFLAISSGVIFYFNLA